MKKLISVLLAGAMLAGVLAGCSGDTTATSSASAGSTGSAESTGGDEESQEEGGGETAEV